MDVPNILAEDTAHGWLVIEDLGDETLANWLLKNPGDREALYRKAVSDLARAQNELATLPSGCVVASRTFDFDLLRWEIEHFREWGLDARDKPLAPDDVAKWNGIADWLARRVAELPSGFVHRDYQSRNIMVVPGQDGSRLVWIDFQDALLGPRVYDLVALLNDSYQQFDCAFVEARLDDYANAAALSRGFSKESRMRLLSEFDLVTVQRKLKDAGRFVFIDRQKGNPSFLKFVTPDDREGRRRARASRPARRRHGGASRDPEADAARRARLSAARSNCPRIALACGRASARSFVIRAPLVCSSSKAQRGCALAPRSVARVAACGSSCLDDERERARRAGVRANVRSPTMTRAPQTSREHTQGRPRGSDAPPPRTVEVHPHGLHCSSVATVRTRSFRSGPARCTTGGTRPSSGGRASTR